jgi:hypothetical protein
MQNTDPDQQESPRRLRLHARKGSEHRFRFARRWEARRRSRSGLRIWALVSIDVGAAALIYLLLRQLVARLSG